MIEPKKYITDPNDPGRVVISPDYEPAPRTRRPHRPPPQTWKLPEHARQVFEHWLKTGDEESLRKLSLAHHPSYIKERFLRQLANITPSRFNARTHHREFLMQRINHGPKPHHGQEEVILRHASEWSPKPNPEAAAGPNAVSAWIPEAKIAFIPAVAGQYADAPWAGDPYHVITGPLVAQKGGSKLHHRKHDYRSIKHTDLKQALGENAPDIETEEHHTIPVAENVDWHLRNLFGNMPPVKEMGAAAHAKFHGEQNKGKTAEDRSTWKKLASSEAELEDVLEKEMWDWNSRLKKYPTLSPPIPLELHAVIGPKGEHHIVPPTQTHQTFMGKFPEFKDINDSWEIPETAQKNGWIIAGHAGTPSFTMSDDLERSPRHPAIVKLRSLLKQYRSKLPNTIEVNGGKADLDHFIKHGIVVHPMSLSASEKSSLTYEQESEIIKENQETGKGQNPHEFVAAKWTFPNGHPRCRLCGEEERIGGCAGHKYFKKDEDMDKSLKHLRPRLQGMPPTPEKDSVKIPSNPETSSFDPQAQINYQQKLKLPSALLTQALFPPEFREPAKEASAKHLASLPETEKGFTVGGKPFKGHVPPTAPPSFIQAQTYGSGHSSTEHHEGFHRLHHALIQRHGKEKIDGYIQSLTDKVPSHVKDYIGYMLQTAYKNQPGAGLDEFFPQLITLASDPKSRKAFLDYQVALQQSGQKMFPGVSTNGHLDMVKYRRLIQDAKHAWNMAVTHINSLPADYFESKLAASE